ncbi:hypothetical protein ACTMTF_46770 [Nonomuraea sp. ZG12]|uniref:hypothetical protein n=1 Tax=Nonomuraea sp. ZG12 TaxID=3452207 RepID=UPI003F8A556E
MATPQEAEQALRMIARLADEQGGALDRVFRLFGDGALLGSGAARLHGGLVERHSEVRRAFEQAFQQVERLALAGGDPVRIPAPQFGRPPEALRDPPGGYVGGDPDLMRAVDAELAEAGGDWRQAGHVLASALARLGVGTAPAQDLVRAGNWLDDQRADLRRRRAELLKTTPAPTTPPPQETTPPPPESSSPPPESSSPTHEDMAPPHEDVAPPAQDGRPGTSAAEETPFGRLAGAVNDVVAWAGSAWAGQVGAAAGALGLPGVGELARGYAEYGAIPLVQGAAEATIGIAEFGWTTSIGGLITDPGAIPDLIGKAGDAGVFAAEHPVEFGKSVVDWETLTEEPVRWFGRLVPDALLAITGGGLAGRAGRTVDGLGVPPAATPGGFRIPPARTAADGPPLDTIPMRERHVGEDQRGVRYLTPEALERRRLVVHDGRLHDITGKPFDTEDAHSHWAPGGGRAIFVMDRYGNLYAEKEHVVGEFHHSSFLSGGRVTGAGDIEVENGVLTAISRHSGHYRPKPEDLDRVIGALKRAGIDVDGVQREGYDGG